MGSKQTKHTFTTTSPSPKQEYTQVTKFTSEDSTYGDDFNHQRHSMLKNWKKYIFDLKRLLQRFLEQTKTSPRRLLWEAATFSIFF